nr:MAG TPA: hypothetical protein [Caudoviricetes sp.]
MNSGKRKAACGGFADSYPQICLPETVARIRCR